MVSSIYKGYRKSRKTRKMLYKNVSGLPVYLWLLIIGYLIFKNYKLQLSQWWDGLFSSKIETLPTRNANISPTEAQKRADLIHSAFGKFNDDEALIFDQLKDVNLHAYNLIYNFYGKRNHTPLFEVQLEQDLTQNLMEFLNTDERRQLISINPALSFLL